MPISKRLTPKQAALWWAENASMPPTERAAILRKRMHPRSFKMFAKKQMASIVKARVKAPVPAAVKIIMATKARERKLNADLGWDDGVHGFYNPKR